MKVLITGGAGYVGTSLIPQLLNKGYKVRVLDNLMCGGDQLLPFFRNVNFEFQKGDIRKIEDIKEGIKGVDVIIHLAAIVGYPACRKSPKLAEEVNVNGTINLISASSKDQLILFASTSSTYGALEDVCTETSLLNPLSLYGQTKCRAEKLLMDRGNTIIYRFATAFGVSPRLRLDLLINDFAYKAFTEGYLVVYEKNFMRTFVHVFDMGRSFLFGIENSDKLRNEVFNIGSENMVYSKEDICEIIKKHIKVYVHYAEVGEDADKRNYVVSYKKISDLGFKTLISIDEGLDELIRAFQVVQVYNKYLNI